MNHNYDRWNNVSRQDRAKEKLPNVRNVVIRFTKSSVMSTTMNRFAMIVCSIITEEA